MPNAVAGFIAWEFFGATVTGYWIAYAAVYAATSYALTRATASLGADDPNGAGRGLEVSVTDTGAEGIAIYGKVRIAGVNIIPAVTGSDGGNPNATARYLEQIQALAVHEVDSFVDVYIDDVQITSAQITAVTGTSNDGKVTATKFANAMWMRRYRGTSTQTVDFILNDRYPSVFTSDFRGRGIAYAAMTFDWGDGKVYTGWPIATFEVKGKKCYDPRLDSSPGANPTNAAYAAWTENPALCWADFALADYGGRCVSSAIDWDSVVDAADICDVLVNIPGATTQKRYTFNGRVLLARDWRENGKLFIDAMLGRWVYRDGRHRIYAGAWEAATTSIEKTDWLAIDRIKTVARRDGGRWNTVRCWYVDPSRNWQRVECYPRRNATYKSSDGAEEIVLPMEQYACTSEYEAQRKAELLLRQSRNQIGLSGRLPPRFRKIATGEVVALTFEELGWVSKLMRVRSMNLNPDGTVEVGLVEEQEADWNDLAAGEYNQPSSSTIPANNPTTPSEPTLSIENHINGTLRFKLAEPTVKPLGTKYQIIRSLVNTNAAVGTIIYEGDTRLIDLVSPSSVHYYWSRAYSNSYFSAYSPNTIGISAVPLPLDSFQVNSNLATDVFFANSTGVGSNSGIGGQPYFGIPVQLPGLPCRAIVTASALFRRNVVGPTIWIQVGFASELIPQLYPVLNTSHQLYTMQHELDVASSTAVSSAFFYFNVSSAGALDWSDWRMRVELIKR